MKYDTDKYQSGLAEIYWEKFNEYKDRSINLLEIGTYMGGSMLMFENMLPKANIYGFDILPRQDCLKNSRVITKVIDQNDSEAIEVLAKEANGFDIIIDDGCHYTKETKNCFDILWKHLRSGGIYIIEDWVAALKEKNNPNRIYAESLAGMDELVFGVASRKEELGISEIEIVVQSNWLSYAIYRKK